ncbi:helix-turn-helix domain-containing protein [Burkholderia cepacia]|uniref:helix-turn-helix domain-containing protein n=1 Tax=Burkholderia cepacia TaxID=292 RepID=UPI001CF221B8|nr:helix-turn-helix transcriptional regulator [Burkholderia cepacia]MCA8031104.1 helix-turn-helix domain-containing protein [Burkholderia cepacia]
MVDLNEGSIAASQRGELLLKWRKTLGWTVGDTAKLLDVSERTIALWEAGHQVMPDVRWRLLVHEVVAKIQRLKENQGTDDDRELVVIVSAEQTPLDVVSNENYAGYALSDDGATGLVASYSVNRQTGAPAVHRQRFPVGPNRSAINAFDRWEANAKARTMNPAAFQMERWVMRRVLAGELANPRLTALKQAVSDASAAVDEAGASEDERAKLMRKLDLAIADLMEEVAKATRAAGV